MVKRIASGPPDQPDIRIFITPPIIIESTARVFEHVGDTGDRDELRSGICPLRQSGKAQSLTVQTHMVHCRIAEADASAGQADLAQHRGQSDRGPEGLLSVILAGERQGHGNHRPAGGHPPGKRANRLGRQRANTGGPIR